MEKSISIRNILSLYTPPLLLMSTIFLLSHQPTLPGPTDMVSGFLFSKLAHVGFYGLLFMSWVRALKASILRELNLYIVVFMICIIFAFSDELHQLYIPGRHGRGMDVLIDGYGMLVAFLKLNRWI